MTAAALPRCAAPDCGEPINLGDLIDHTSAGMVHLLCVTREPHPCPKCDRLLDWCRHGYWVHVDNGTLRCPTTTPAADPVAPHLAVVRTASTDVPRACRFCGDATDGTTECTSCATEGGSL